MPSAYYLRRGVTCADCGVGGLYTCSGFVEEGKTQPGQRRGCYWEAQQQPGGGGSARPAPTRRSTSPSVLTSSNPQQTQFASLFI